MNKLFSILTSFLLLFTIVNAEEKINIEKQLIGIVGAVSGTIKTPIRDLKILGENIQIFFNYYKSELLIIEKNKKQRYKLKNFKRNDMFIDEIKYFFKCLKINKKSNLENDFYLLKYLV